MVIVLDFLKTGTKTFEFDGWSVEWDPSPANPDHDVLTGDVYSYRTLNSAA
jgi:hypothetical protein